MTALPDHLHPDAGAAASPSSARLCDALAWLTLAFVAVIAALTFRSYGLGWDDYTHAQYADLLLEMYRSGFRDTRALSFVNLYLYGGGFDMAAALLAKVLPFDLFETRRLAGAVVGIVGLALTWRLARRLAGPLAGLAALLLLATCPLFYGHMFINPKDAPFAVAMVGFLLGLVRLIEEYPRPSATTLIITGLGFGLSIGSRIMAGFGVFEAAAAFALLFFADAARAGLKPAAARLGRLALALIPCALLAYAVMGVVWPWSVANPLNPVTAIETFAHFFEKPWRELFDGQLIEVPDMPRRYVPMLFAYRAPLVFLLLGFGGALALTVAAFRKQQPARARAAYLAVACAALLPLIVTVITRPAMYNGIRHFIFVLPPLAIAGGIASAAIAARLQPLGRAAFLLAVAAFIAGIAVPVVGMTRLHPYEYAYYNTLAGGVRGAQPRFMLDYWGLAFKQAGAALRAEAAAGGNKPAWRRWRVAVCGPHPPAQIALGPDFEVTWDAPGADFALMLGVFYCADLNAPKIVDIVRDGVSFARAYDLRGRTVPTLFRYPPVQRDAEPDKPSTP